MKAFYEQLMVATEARRAELLSVPTLQRGVRGDIPLASYTAFLTEAYHHVKHTVPLLMACGSRLPERLEWLRAAVGEYVREEMGHQEWVLEDLAACGADSGAVRDGSPREATELMVAYAWDTVSRHNPVGFFGMVLVLEGTSVQLALHAADAIQRRLALPDAAFSYLRSHGALDASHMQHFRALMNRLDDAEDRAAVVHRARVFYRLYAEVFRALPLAGEPAGEREVA